MARGKNLVTADEGRGAVGMPRQGAMCHVSSPTHRYMSHQQGVWAPRDREGLVTAALMTARNWDRPDVPPG